MSSLSCHHLLRTGGHREKEGRGEGRGEGGEGRGEGRGEGGEGRGEGRGGEEGRGEGESVFIKDNITKHVYTCAHNKRAL